MNYNHLNTELKGLQIIPIGDKKNPLPDEWQKTKSDHNLNSYGVGLVCGKLSGNVEAIDIDLKYDLTGTLFQRYKQAINEIDKDLLKKLVVQKTGNNGYHFVYRSVATEGNMKLANRPTTENEKSATYKKTYEAEIVKGKSESEAAKTAERSKNNDNVRVLIETRGEGGYIAIHPTPKYQLIYRNFADLQELTIRERNILINCAKQFNEVFKELKPPPTQHKTIKGNTSFEDYNERGDVIGLLEKNGWTNVGQKGSKVLMKRPGATDAAHSGNYDIEKKWFSVFSTSTEFDSETAYLPYAVYAYLECNKDFAAASKKLYEEGYGERVETAKDNNVKTPSRFNALDDDYSFIATEKDYVPYLNSWRNGTFERGLSTGYEPLDTHFVFKKSSLVMINGVDNVGKSVFIWHLAMNSAILHGWNWIIFSSENSVGSFMRKMIEFYWHLPLVDLSDTHIAEATKFINEHFAIIKSDDELYNYQDILVMARKLMKKKKYHSLLIDPYNSLKIDLHSKSKLSTHEYHYEVVSDMKLFVSKEECCIYLNCHVITSAARMIKGEKELEAPHKADIEGGQKFANKADDFLTIHRHVGNADKYMQTEVHVRKIKETETGGKVTPFESPIILTANKALTGWTDINGNNPIKSIRGKIVDNYGSRPLTPIRDITEAKKESQSVMYNPNTQEFVPITNNETNEPIPF